MVKLAEKLTLALSWLSYRTWLAEVYPYLLLLGLCLPALFWQLEVYPAFWFDEGYKANAARTLAERGIYGTYTTAGYLPFDPGISVGPVDIIFTALSFKLLGVGVTQARLVAVLFTLLAVFSLHAIAVYLYGRSAGLFVMLILVATPAIQGVSFLLVGRQSLGEGPALGLITLGLWLWFRSWDNGHWFLIWLAGAALGLGLLSKMQVGLALLPALSLIALGRGRKNWRQFSQVSLPIAIALAIVGGWSLLGYLTTSEPIRQENSLMLRDAIASNILTGLWGRTLTTSAWFIVGLMGVGVLSSGWRLIRSAASASYAVNKWWAEATLALFVLLYMVWFALLSVGWPRYAFVGLMVGVLLLGKLAWDIFQAVCRQIESRWSRVTPFLYPTALLALSLIGLWINLYPNLTFSESTKLQNMADYIRQEIPQDAVIESWAWELDALSGHWQYHHPHQRYLFQAIRQFSHHQQTFDLNYNLLEADPDYLITDSFSTWTGIYPDAVITANFVQLTEIGVYRIYRRIR